MFNIYIILLQTSHPGNIGATARAMRTMGLHHLRLVQPKKFPHPDAIAQASGALDVLEQAQVFEDVDQAIADCHLILGTSARHRDFPWPVLTPREAALKVSTEKASKNIAILFGTERYGLSNEDLEHCHFLIQIPTVEQFSSLNLAQAVQVISYEIFQAQLTSKVSSHPASLPLATASQMNALYLHLEEVLKQIKFLDPDSPRLLMRRLKRLGHRLELETSEVQILRGMLKAISQFEKKE